VRRGSIRTPKKGGATRNTGQKRRVRFKDLFAWGKRLKTKIGVIGEFFGKRNMRREKSSHSRPPSLRYDLGSGNSWKGLSGRLIGQTLDGDWHWDD